MTSPSGKSLLCKKEEKKYNLQLIYKDPVALLIFYYFIKDQSLKMSRLKHPVVDSLLSIYLTNPV